MRLKLLVEYDGAGFRGWAAQPGLRTVEGTMRDALAVVFPAFEALAVAGRTDTGVHALGNVVSVDVESYRTTSPSSLPRRRRSTSTRATRRARAAIATASGGDVRRRRSSRSARGGIRVRSRRNDCRTQPTCFLGSTTSARSRRRRRSTMFSCGTCSGRSGTAAAMRSSSRSRRTASCGTWCVRSSAPWWRCPSSGSSPCCSVARAARLAPLRRRTGSTSSEWSTDVCEPWTTFLRRSPG